jgi:predicted acyltransferase
MPTPAPAREPSRLASVDALRGVVMFTMLFVNDVAGVGGIPGWMKHYPARGNGMTFVDWVFGGFLFIVGVSIPIAFHNRLARGEPLWRLVLHVLTRTAGLLLLGVFMVNGERDVVPRGGWPPNLWEFLVYAFGILAFLAPPPPPPGRTPRAKRINLALRLFGFAGFVLLAVVFRDAKGNWMRTSWWGILGLIGWAYLVASIAYLLLRNHRELMAGVVAILIAAFFAADKGFFDRFSLVGDYVDFGSTLGSQAAITMAGVVLGSVLLDGKFSTSRRIGWAVTFGVLLAVGAVLTYRQYGINKNNATPSWCLMCAAYTCWLWALLSLLIDRLGVGRPMNFVIRGGQNVLLAYLLAPLMLHFIWMTHLDFYGKLGAISPTAGVTRSLVLAAVILWLASFLKDRGVRAETEEVARRSGVRCGGKR